MSTAVCSGFPPALVGLLWGPGLVTTRLFSGGGLGVAGGRRRGAPVGQAVWLPTGGGAGGSAVASLLFFMLSMSSATGGSRRPTSCWMGRVVESVGPAGTPGTWFSLGGGRGEGAQRGPPGTPQHSSHFRR